MAKTSQPDLGAMTEKGLDAALKLAQLSFDHSQRLLEHQLTAQRELFEQGLRQLQTLGGAQEPGEALKLQGGYLQESVNRNLVLTQEIAQLNQQFQGEVLKTLGFPGQPTEAMAAMEKLSRDTREGMEEFARRAIELFSPPGKTR